MLKVWESRSKLKILSSGGHAFYRHRRRGKGAALGVAVGEVADALGGALLHGGGGLFVMLVDHPGQEILNDVGLGRRLLADLAGDAAHLAILAHRCPLVAAGVFQLYDGTNEVQKILIARELAAGY
jgi:ribulose 1,5-bisphosphate synthetase/thiazole synthase